MMVRGRAIDSARRVPGAILMSERGRVHVLLVFVLVFVMELVLVLVLARDN